MPSDAASILAVMVAYGTAPAASATLRSLAAALDREDALLDLFVYDNSPEPPAMDLAALGTRFRVTCRHDPANPGVSAAFNAGARLARELGKEWLLLLDQDTDFPPEAMAVYLAAIRSGSGRLFAPLLVSGDRLLSPCGYRAGVGFHLPGAAPGAMPLTGRSVLNSGLLVQLAAFEACGGYDERVRVDFADFAFMDRFRRRWPEIVVVDLVCRHGFSNLETVEESAALRRFAGYCRDGRAAAITPLLVLTHLFLVLRRCTVLTQRYRSSRFISALPAYFNPGRLAALSVFSTTPHSPLPNPSRTISVCMATYNGERFVRDQIGTILPQLADNDELVISDDSSTDGTPAILAELAASDPRIRLFTGNSFRSPVFNFEFALGQARGEIVVLADQDDVWFPNKLATVRGLFARQPARPYLVVLDAQVVDAAGEEISPSVLARLNAGPGFWKNLYDNRYLGCCMAFSRDLLDRALPFPRRIPMHDMWLGQLCERIGTTAFVPEITMQYRKHGASLTDFRIEFRPWLQIKRRFVLASSLLTRTLLNSLKVSDNAPTSTLP